MYDKQNIYYLPYKLKEIWPSLKANDLINFSKLASFKSQKLFVS